MKWFRRMMAIGQVQYQYNLLKQNNINVLKELERAVKATIDQHSALGPLKAAVDELIDAF